MRARMALSALLCCFLLTACFGGLVARAGSEILLAFLKPLVGLDPNASSVFDHPVIRDRMQALLGPNYQPVMSLLATADELQREGPLFYVVSRYTPVPEFAEQAGFVWNAETNQMALMLVSGGSPTVIAEKVVVAQAERVAQQMVPQWPGELQAILDEDALKKRAMEAAVTGAGQVLGVDPALQAPLGQVLQGQVLQGETPAAVAQQQINRQQLEQPAMAPLQQGLVGQPVDQQRQAAEQALEEALRAEERGAAP